MWWERLIWNYYKCKSYCTAVMQYKVLRCPMNWSRWGGRRILNVEAAGRVIENALKEGVPFVAARFGNVEMNAVLATLQERIQGKSEETAKEKIRYELSNNAGMFSNDKAGVETFVSCYLQAAGNIDLLGVWFSEQEEYLIRKYMKTAQLTQLKNLEPYYNKDIPWSRALKGKKVLVIHPFAETIAKQYQKRDCLWENTEILPEFELITYRAIQTIAGQNDRGFPDWISALEYMKEEISLLEFDVALVGCGAYGLPLAVRIKEMGKQAIHLGGATQILFGIRGKRWEEIEFFRNLMNEYWVRPSESEKPPNATVVEEGCYW